MRTAHHVAALTLPVFVCLAGCSDDADVGDDAGVATDTGRTDSGPSASDASANIVDASLDLGRGDSGPLDAATDSGAQGDSGNSGGSDASTDAGFADSGHDASSADAGSSDVGSADSGATDSGSTDAGTADAGASAGDCVSGATGTHAVRFEWLGNGPNSRAYPSYVVNELPDTTRWRITANARSFNYQPVFGDTFLGPGGLIMQGTTFMDIELSTGGLSSISNVSLAIYGRSYNTTSPGSFSWLTFDGSGAAPSGIVANSTPYQWYRADATSAFVPGNAGVLLRIEPEGPSNSLVVNGVEICFDAT
jgi:hypothetical protein